MGAGLIYPYTPPDGSVPAFRAGLHKRKSLSNKLDFNILAGNVVAREVPLDISPCFQKEGDILIIHSASAEMFGDDTSGAIQINNLAVALRDSVSNQNFAWFPTFLINAFGAFAIPKPAAPLVYNWPIPPLRWDDFTDYNQAMGGVATPQGLRRALLVLHVLVTNSDGGAAHAFNANFSLLYDTQNLNLTGTARSGL